MGKEKRYYWLQLKEDFFGQKEIKRLRKIAGGDTYTIIYLKMLLKSLRTNGFLYFEGIESDFVAELALDIDEDEDNVEVTVNYLKTKGILVEKSEDEYFLTTCPEMVGSEAASARRVRQHREKQKQTLQCNGQALHCNSDVTKCNTEIEIDKEKELEIELESERELEIERREELDREKELEAVKHLFVTTCPSYITYPTQTSSITLPTRQAILASLQMYSLDDFKTMFEKAEHSSFLKGENEQGWKAVFGWLVKAENMQKVLAGAYDDDKWTVIRQMCHKANKVAYGEENPPEGGGE